MNISSVFKTRDVGKLLFCWLLPFLLMAQNGKFHFDIEPKPRVERLSFGQELDGFTVKCLIQDREGFIWFGTARGLVKYDGYTTKVYKYSAVDTTSLSSDHILSIYEDRAGALWIGTLSKGLNRFNKSTGKFTRHLRNPDNPASLSHNQVHSILEDSWGFLWVGTTNGLNRLNHKTGKFTRFLPDSTVSGAISHKVSRVILESRDSTLWIGTNNGLNRFDRERETFTTYTSSPDSLHTLSSNYISALFEDSSGHLWVGTITGGVNRFHPQQNSAIRYVHQPNNPNSISNNTVWAINEDDKGRIWIGTEGGVNILDPLSGRFQNLRYHPDDPQNIFENDITDIYKDNTGTLWIASGSLWERGNGGPYGINRIDFRQNQFSHLYYEPAAGESKTSVHTIIEDRNGLLWVGTSEGGLYSVDLSRKAITGYLHNPQNPQSISGNKIMAIHEDSEEMLWIGIRGNGLNRFDRNTGRFKHYKLQRGDSTSLSHNLVTNIFEDSKKRLWISTYGGGLNQLNRESGTFLRYLHDPDDKESLSANHLSAVIEDSSGLLWVATNTNGINRFDPESGKFRQFIHDPKDPQSISNNRLWRAFCDHEGTIWATTSGGLNRFDPTSETFKRYTAADGLSDNLVYGALEDDHGNLWLNVRNSITRFDPQSETLRSFTNQDGLINTWWKYGEFCRSSDGRMFFGGDGGIDFFHPDSLRDNPHIPPIVFTRFIRYQTDRESLPVTDDHISHQKEVVLSYGDPAFSFEFAALNYRSPEENQYAYKLIGAHDQWTYLGHQRSITFSNLSPGKYQLHVKGSNNDGIWNNEGASIDIIITPPWWRTNWAYLAYILSALGLLYFLRTYELNRQHLKHNLKLEQIEKEKLQELDQSKSRFFAGISHEFRTPLTLISAPLEQLRSGTFKGDIHQQYALINRNCKHLLRLIDQLLDLSRLESGKMQLQAREQDVMLITRQLTAAFYSLAVARKITLTFQGTETAIMAYLDREHYEKIINNLIHNALKFTPGGGSITVDCQKHERHPEKEIPGISLPASADAFVEISINDDGIGISAAQLPHIFDRFYRAENTTYQESKGSGIGLALSKELAELHYGGITVQSDPGKGSTFTIFLPLGKAHLRPEEILAPTSEESLPDPSDHISEYEAQFLKSPASDPPPASAPSPSPSQTVLIVEDNPDMRLLIRDILHDDFNIIEAVDGVKGLEKAQATDVDIIISDIMMPEMDGYQFCERVKSDERISHIPVILLTALSSQDHKIEGLEKHADAYLTKPFSTRELLVRLRNLLNQREIMRKRYSKEVIDIPLSEITTTPVDEQFLQRATDIVEKNMQDESFTVEQFASEMALSRKHLHRKLKALTNLTPRDFIRTTRLKRAAQLFKNQGGTVADIAYATGFGNLSYFSKAFKEQFGSSPSEYLAKHQSSD